jgi:hypothetical protein
MLPSRILKPEAISEVLTRNQDRASSKKSVSSVLCWGAAFWMWLVGACCCEAARLLMGGINGDPVHGA